MPRLSEYGMRHRLREEYLTRERKAAEAEALRAQRGERRYRLLAGMIIACDAVIGVLMLAWVYVR